MIFLIVGVLLLMGGVFLGANFLFSGVLYISVPIALIIGSLTFILVSSLIKLKSPVQDYFAALKKKRILWILYLLFSLLVSFPFFLHFITVSLVEKDQIQSYYEKDINDFKALLDNFKKEKNEMRRIIKIGKENNSNSQDLGRIDQESDSEVLPLQKTYSEIKSKSDNFNFNFENALHNWNLFTIGSYIKNWNIQKEEWLSKLTETHNAVNNKNGNIRKSFDISMVQNSDSAPAFDKLNTKNASWAMGIILLLIVHFIILMSYLVVKDQNMGYGKIVKPKKLEGGTDTL